VNVDPPTDPKDYVHRAGRTARAGESGTVVTLVPAGGRREAARVIAEAGIEAGVTKVRSGEAELSRITGARTPSGSPLDGGPAAPRPKNTNRPFRGLGTSKDTSRGGGRPSRKAGHARKLAEPRKAAHVRRTGRRARPANTGTAGCAGTTPEPRRHHDHRARPHRRFGAGRPRDAPAGAGRRWHLRPQAQVP